MVALHHTAETVHDESSDLPLGHIFYWSWNKVRCLTLSMSKSCKVRFCRMASQSVVSSSPRVLRVAVVGVGLVGGEFVDQLLTFPRPNPFRIVSLSSTKTTLFSPDGLDLSPSTWKQSLTQSGLKPDLDFLSRELLSLVKPGQDVVLVDNTSSNEVAALYPRFLKYGVHVITPNKKAFSAELSLHESIMSASLESGARFLNEATVGAGLPIISTLKDLVATGDKVVKQLLRSMSSR